MSNLLNNLFLNRDYKGIVEYCNKSPRSIETTYCEAIAYFLDNYPLKGLMLLMEIIQNFYKTESLEAGKNLKFFGECGAQLAKLAEFSLQRHFCQYDQNDTLLLASFISTGTKTASIAGKILCDKSLIQKATDFSSRLWSVSHGDSKTETIFWRPDSPLCLQVEPTNHCNLDCAMCSRKKMRRPTGNISLKTLEKALFSWKNRQRSIYLKHLVHCVNVKLKLNGAVKLFFLGEPLMHRNIDSLLSTIKNSGANVGVQTNGILLNKPKIRKRLIENLPNSISISLDGKSPETYERIRKGGDWKQCQTGIVTFIKELREAGLRDEINLSVASILDQPSDKKKMLACEFLGPINDLVDKINFITINTINDPDFIDDKGDLVRKSRKSKSKIPNKTILCEESLSKVNILWDGLITPCCNDINAEITLGNVSQGVDSVWNGEKTVALHKALTNGDLENYPLCKYCLTTK